MYALSSIEFFIATFLGLCFIICRGKLQYFARLIEILSIVAVISLSIGFFLNITEIDFKNLYPVTTNDAENILKSQVPVMGITAFIFSTFFIGGKLSTSKEVKKYGIKGAIFITLIGILSIVITVGIFGAEVTKNLTLPFSLAMKEINIFGKIYGLESIFVSLWLISDLALVASCVYVIKNLTSKITNTEGRREFVTPVIFLIYILSLWIVNNRYEYEFFLKEFVIKCNIALGYILPFIVLVIGKIRKKI